MGRAAVATAAGTAVLTTGCLAAAAACAVAAPGPRTAALVAAGLVVCVPSAVLGVQIARVRPANPVGPLLALVGWTFSLVVAKETGIRLLALHRDVADRWAGVVAVLAENLWAVFAAVGLLLLWFPDGALPGRRWRAVPPLLVACAGLQQAYGAFDVEPFRAPLADVRRPFGQPPAWLEVASGIGFGLLLLLVVAAAASVAGRFRRGDRTLRAQVKWIGLAGFGVALYPPLCLLEILAFGHTVWVSAAVGLAGLVGIPLATGIAVLRHDLYDVDKAWAFAATWALVTVVLLAGYAALSSAVGLLLGRGSPATVAAVTATCALALLPLRSRLQRVVDRRVYPLRSGAFAALDALHRDVSAGVARPEELEAVLRVALRDPALRVGFRLPGRDDHVDADGRAVRSDGGATVVFDGREIGVLVAGRGPASAELLRQVAARATTATEVVRLRLELAAALRDVESSRARLVRSGDAERRRLERDLHDGAQQRLVSLGMGLRVAQRHLDDGTVDLSGVLDEAVAELGTAVAELRQIARGLRPASLDDGLPAALAGLVRGVPVPVDMEVCPDRLPDDVATTVYFVVSEAVANTLKHADAQCIRLRVERVEGEVTVRVSDDGHGGAALPPRSALADRVAALGGRLRVESPPGRGTVVEAALPCVS